MFKLEKNNGSFPYNMSCSLHFTFVFILLLTYIITQTNIRNNVLLLISNRSNSPVVNNPGNVISSTSTQTGDNDIYDIILFTGQSNMVGSAREVVEKRYNHNQFTYPDAISPGEYAALTKIKSSILRKNGKTLNFVSIKQKSHTAYEYMYLTNSFREIDSTKKVNYGENLTYINGELLDYKKTDQKYLSLAKSSGTNMIPQFCQTYYNLTGHKVIAVCAGKRGVPIQTFLPQSDKRNTRFECFVYEAIKEKYKAAVQLAESQNLHIGNKLYVIAQGESDIGIKTTKKQYKQMFMSMHKRLKKDLGIETGAIVETSTTTGTANMKMLEAVHQAQEELIKENKDIILGSSYFYDRFVPREKDYKNCNTKVTIRYDGKKLPYKEALRRSRFSTDPSYKKETGKRNYIHFTSAALSQVGMEVATSFSKIIH